MSETPTEPPRQIYLRLQNLTRTFGSTVALEGLNLEVARGEILTILGPSGSGKSTTLNLIAGFDFPTDGEIFIAEREITWAPPFNRDIGMVFQNYALFPHMSVFENVAFPLRARRVRAEALRSSVRQALALVQLQHLADRLPRQLSGGQQQRVALARAVVYRPSVLLM